MTGPTAIPHPETSSHHRNPSEPAVINTNLHASAPRNNRNSPPLVSPVYTRTAFSLPGPISPSSSFRNTANGWTATGVGSTSNGIKSPTAVHSTLAAQRDYFPESASTAGAGNTRHHRSTSASSTTSSIDSLGPTTPRSEAPPSMGGAPLGRVHSIPLGTSPYEHIKGRRNSIVGGQQLGAGWTGFGTLRGRTSDASERGGIPASTNGSTTAATTSNATGGMGGLFRKLSLSGTSPVTGAPHQSRHRHDHRSASLSSDAGSTTSEGPNVPLAPNAPVSAPPTTGSTPALEAQPKMRGRQGSMSATKRKPSPHGERLLMGWTHAH